MAIDEVRRAEAAQIKRDGYEPILTKSRWCLLKRRENLTGNQEIKLEPMKKVAKSLRRHRLLRLIAEGGIGEGRQEKPRRPVAVKVIKPPA